MKKLFFALIGVAFLSALSLSYFLTARDAHTVEFSAPAITEVGKGMLIGFTVKATPGSGRVLVNIENAFYREDVENSIKKAKAIAGDYLGLNPNGFDLTIELKSSQKIVGGESAGVAFVTAIAAAMSGKKIRSDVAVSAAVDERGNALAVNGVDEKILSAIELEKNYFIVAESQTILHEQTLSKSIQIVRVKNAGDAIKLMVE
ncbi:hypothetical protein HY993_03485 [Candidatus Micrarchaeota archaeon]|nr:hypothetical protein [Candidatus Micrarchaeota archaeon]